MHRLGKFIVLHEDFLALPGIVARLGDRIEQLTERMDAQTLRMDELIRVVNKLVGQVGNLEGWRFESKYVDHLATHLFRRYRNVRPIVLGIRNSAGSIFNSSAKQSMTVESTTRSGRISASWTQLPMGVRKAVAKRL